MLKKFECVMYHGLEILSSRVKFCITFAKGFEQHRALTTRGNNILQLFLTSAYFKVAFNLRNIAPWKRREI